MDRKFSLFLVVSTVLHLAFIFATKMELTKPKPEYMDSTVLLMGENKGTKINPPKPKKKKRKKTVKVVQPDPDALKVKSDKPVEEVVEEEGTFGQGGTKELPYDVELAAWIKVNLKYPKIARRLGHECIVKVSFQIEPNGKITDVKVAEPCEFDTLNSAAVKTVYKASPFKPFPENFKKVAMTKIQPISFKLNR